MSKLYGSPMSLDDITLSNALAHPIWVWVWEAGMEGLTEDETWQCPVLETTDVTDDFVEPIITVRVTGTDAYGSASYDRKQDRLEAIALWHEDAWVSVRQSGRPTPFTVVAVPTIRGVSEVQFVCSDASTDIAVRL